VQVSGKTIYLPDASPLPVHNVPVVHIGFDFAEPVDSGAVTAAVRAGAAQLDLAPAALMAIAFAWAGDPDYPRLRAAAEGIVAAVAADAAEPLLLMIDGDVGRTFGQLLDRELGVRRPVIAIDGVQLQPLDFVDLGEMIDPPGVVPVVIKSLLFSSPTMTGRTP
jgi:ethanolamine utilization protein EutA